MRLKLLMSGLAVVVSATGAHAEAAAVASPPASVAARTTPPDRCCLIPSGTIVDIELTQLVSSKTARPGDHFKIKLAEDLVFNDRVMLASGAEGLGEVVDSAPSGLAGRAGKLVLAARFVESGGVRLPLRGFRLSGGGHDGSKTAAMLMMTPYVGILAFGVHGGNIDYPAGTRAQAKILADTPVELPSAQAFPSKTVPPQPSVEKAP